MPPRPEGVLGGLAGRAAAPGRGSPPRDGASGPRAGGGPPGGTGWPEPGGTARVGASTTPRASGAGEAALRSLRSPGFPRSPAAGAFPGFAAERSSLDVIGSTAGFAADKSIFDVAGSTTGFAADKSNFDVIGSTAGFAADKSIFDVAGSTAGFAADKSNFDVAGSTAGFAADKSIFDVAGSTAGFAADKSIFDVIGSTTGFAADRSNFDVTGSAGAGSAGIPAFRLAEREDLADRRPRLASARVGSASAPAEAGSGGPSSVTTGTTSVGASSGSSSTASSSMSRRRRALRSTAAATTTESISPNSRVAANTFQPVVRTGGPTTGLAGVSSRIREPAGTDRSSWCSSSFLVRSPPTRLTSCSALSAESASARTVIMEDPGRAVTVSGGCTFRARPAPEGWTSSASWAAIVAAFAYPPLAGPFT
ncbi:hypothetical protein BKA01_008478 [Pseudonocardia eucalypti]|uniref:hypothetical protein n=1 Tax=Pseudonocardia eucalypti TaxID=648755 RepID=UPI0016170EC0|nr:hypothetical protein [Pseudonocardia eucalypti]